MTMIRNYFLLLLCGLAFTASAQFTDEEDKYWEAQLLIGQYPAALLAPNFDPLHLGIQVGASYQYNSHPVHHWTQTSQLAWFKHRHFQTALQLYTEAAYEYHGPRGLILQPLALGGGIVFAAQGMPTAYWSSSDLRYYRSLTPVRVNWMISLGAGIGYRTPFKIQGRPVTLLARYRTQVQGIVVRNTVPVIAYAPVMVGMSVPF